MPHPSHGYSSDPVSSGYILFFCHNPSILILTSGQTSESGSVHFSANPQAYRQQ
jgi:hypothetical protein